MLEIKSHHLVCSSLISLFSPLSFQGFLDNQAGNPQIIILRLLRYIIRLIWRMQ